jgi:hypothetical protein
MTAPRQGCFGRRFALRKIEGEGNPRIVAKKKISVSKDTREKYEVDGRGSFKGKETGYSRQGSGGVGFLATPCSAGHGSAKPGRGVQKQTLITVYWLVQSLVTAVTYASTIFADLSQANLMLILYI